MGELSIGIGVVGLGFVGLTTALGFADRGFTVRGFDVDDRRAAMIDSGKVPFFEPGLEDALARANGRTFFVSGSYDEFIDNSDVLFICVGTPSSSDGSADLGPLLGAVNSICEHAGDGRKRLIVIKSTVPPGTAEGVILPHLARSYAGFGKTFVVAINPEFLREGHCWEDFINPDRIVCGVTDEWSKGVFDAIYAPFGAPVRFVTPGTAEFIKYLSNSLLATLISYSNEMSLIADNIGGIDVGAAFRALHEDKRWRGTGITSYIYPGCGYGGYCLPKDAAALAAKAAQAGFEPRILASVIDLNNRMPSVTAQKIGQLASGRDKNIGILGLSFKPGSDDVRDSPAAKIISSLLDDGYRNIFAYDPVASEAFRSVYDLDIVYCGTKEELCKQCSTVAVVTTWEEFRGIHLQYPQITWCDCRYWLEG